MKGAVLDQLAVEHAHEATFIARHPHSGLDPPQIRQG